MINLNATNWITLKAAASLDAFIDDDKSERLIISSSEDHQAVQRLRAEADAILVGGETVRKDNPNLTVQSKPGESKSSPKKIVLSNQLNFDQNFRIFENPQDLILVSSNPKAKTLSKQSIILPEDFTADDVIGSLNKVGIKRLLIEGGAEVLNFFMQTNSFDYFRYAQSPFFVTFGKKFSPPKQCELSMIMTEEFGYTNVFWFKNDSKKQ